MTWMAWTPPTALFFAAVGGTLIAMTLWELRAPTALRKGFLPMATTRGDRLFISALAAALLHLLALALSDAAPWAATGVAVVLAIVLLRWG